MRTKRNFGSDLESDRIAKVAGQTLKIEPPRVAMAKSNIPLRCKKRRRLYSQDAQSVLNYHKST